MISCNESSIFSSQGFSLRAASAMNQAASLVIETILPRSQFFEFAGCQGLLPGQDVELSQHFFLLRVARAPQREAPG